MLSKGIYERLRVAPETLRMLERRDVPAHVLQTAEAAVRVYNELREAITWDGRRATAKVRLSHRLDTRRFHAFRGVDESKFSRAPELFFDPSIVGDRLM